MYAASSSVSTPPRPYRRQPPGAGPFLDPALGGRARRAPGPGPLSGRLDMSGPQGAQLRTAIASVHR
ncbi:aminoglycoside phosphotransferase family protein, partial [Streptomyces sp. MCAF7]